jgi:hypothetical protein
MKLTSLILSNDDPNIIRILVLTGIAWLPLMVLTLIDGTFYTSEITIPFIKDVTPLVRGLIVIPMLVMADNLIEPMMTRVLNYLKVSGVVADSEKEYLSSAAEKMTRQMNSKLLQIILVVLVVAVSWLLQTDYVEMWKEDGVTSWMLQLENSGVDETLAGSWFLLVTSPLVSFLLYRWIWRFIVWSLFLYRVSRMKLELYASHTDFAAGLGMIGVNHALFSILFIIMATLVSSEIAGNILYEGDTLVDMKQLVIVFIAISLVVLFIPLLFFTNKLIHVKHKALVTYGTLQNQLSGDFHKHWIKDQAKNMVDSMQPSAMADYSAVYEIVSNMRIVPITTKTIVVVAALILLPFLPLALTESSIWDILQMIGGSLF